MKTLRFFLIVLSLFALALFSANAQGRRGGGQPGGQGGEQRPLAKLDKTLETVGAPWTAGRAPVWQDK